jgi:hypothetical protein
MQAGFLRKYILRPLSFQPPFADVLSDLFLNILHRKQCGSRLRKTILVISRARKDRECVASFIWLFCVVASLAFAQDRPKEELFFGYSYVNADTSGLTNRLNMNGADVSFVVNLSQWGGAETNFSAYFTHLNIEGVSLSVHDYNILFGPRLHYKWAFVHALAGLDDFGGSALGGSTTNGAFGGGVGGGVAFKITKHIGVEGGGDYLITRHNLLGGSAITQNHARAFAGIVFNFGNPSAPQEPLPQSAPKPVSMPRQHTTSAGMSIAALGITVVLGRADGAEIIDVIPNSATALAGLHAGDVINAVDGKPIKTPMELSVELSSKAAGDKVHIGYMIGGQWQAETVIIMPR